MIILRNDQLEALRAESRKRLIEVIQRGLLGQGLTVERRDSALVLIDSRKQETRLTFQRDGLPDSIMRPSGVTYHFEFDDAGRLAVVAYPGGRQLVFSRDDVGNVTALHQPGLATYQLSYGEPALSDARLRQVTYPDGRTRNIDYDEAGQVAAIAEPSGARYDFERNQRGNISAIVDPLLRKIELISDDEGSLQGVEFPDGSLEAFLFDDEEQAAVRVHRDGSETRYQLDDQDRIAQIISGIDGATGFGYDDKGNLSFVEQAGQRISFKIDGENTTEEKSPDGKVLYEYDGDGQLTELRDPFGDHLKYDYDQDGRLCNITIWDGRRIHISSDDEDLTSRIEFPGGIDVLQQHSPTLRLSHRQVKNAHGLVQEISYHYDVCSRFTGSIESAPGATEYQVCYDEDDHVVLENTMGRSQRYDFDQKGNMVRCGELEVTVGPMDEPLCFGGQSINYDERGNMLHLPGGDGTLECTYRQDGLLTKCHSTSGTVTFRYDALGRRIEKRTKGHIWHYGWTGHQLLWEEHKASENATPVHRDYLFLPGTLVPLGFREEGRYYWLMTDARGAVDLALDDQGKVVWKASYDSFGNASIEVNQVRQPWRLQGQYADDETGLYYNFARYYSPHLRSYLSLDPRWIELDASHYSYCRNDPWNRADPFGGLAPLLVLGIAGVVGGLVGGITAVVTGGDPMAGAVEGAVGGAGAVVAVVAGASAAVVVAAGIVATGVGAFAGQMTEQARRGNKVSIKCALKGAAFAAATDLVLLGLGKVPFVKQLAKWAGKKLAKLVKPLKKFAKGKLNQAKGLLKKLKGRSKLDKALARHAKRAAKVRQRAISRSNMVPKHAEAFSEVAQVRDEFILTRPVNPDAKAMIANGSATKSMHIKGKSSDWGPMKGAIPVDQNYSKLAKGDPAEIAAKQLEVDTLLNPKAGGPVYAKSVPLVVDGKTVLVVKNAAPPPATVIQKGNHFFSATPPGDPIPASKVKPAGSEPLMVLGDPETGAPITADYDLLAIGHNKLDHPDGSAFVKAPYDSELGVMTPAEADTLDALQKATQGKTGDQRVVHHGPEVNNPKPEKFSGPVTAYCPDGSVRSIDTESGLVDLFNEANAKGYRMEPNPGWGWQKNAQTGWWGLP